MHLSFIVLPRFCFFSAGGEGRHEHFLSSSSLFGNPVFIHAIPPPGRAVAVPFLG